MIGNELSGSSKDIIKNEEVKPKSKPQLKPKKLGSPRKEAAPRKARAKMVQLRSLWPSKLVVLEEDMPSGKRYVFPKGGSEIPVDEKDMEVLLARRRPKGCCGAGLAEHRFFELV